MIFFDKRVVCFLLSSIIDGAVSLYVWFISNKQEEIIFFCIVDLTKIELLDVEKSQKETEEKKLPFIAVMLPGN